jgi:hypothetical protein
MMQNALQMLKVAAALSPTSTTSLSSSASKWGASASGAFNSSPCMHEGRATAIKINSTQPKIWPLLTSAWPLSTAGDMMWWLPWKQASAIILLTLWADGWGFCTYGMSPAGEDAF